MLGFDWHRRRLAVGYACRRFMLRIVHAGRMFRCASFVPVAGSAPAAVSALGIVSALSIPDGDFIAEISMPVC